MPAWQQCGAVPAGRKAACPSGLVLIYVSIYLQCEYSACHLLGPSLRPTQLVSALSIPKHLATACPAPYSAGRAAGVAVADEPRGAQVFARTAAAYHSLRDGGLAGAQPACEPCRDDRKILIAFEGAASLWLECVLSQNTCVYNYLYLVTCWLPLTLGTSRSGPSYWMLLRLCNREGAQMNAMQLQADPSQSCVTHTLLCLEVAATIPREP